MIAIIDYGMGNIHSVRKALQALGAKTIVAGQSREIKNCPKIVLPGVGAFADAIEQLKRRNFIPALKKHIREGKIFLGICLGMQLLFENSQEAKDTSGLALLGGEVKRFPHTDALKVPHIGWNNLKIRAKDCPLLKNVRDNSYVYFCHSYFALPKQPRIIAATTFYGRGFTSVVWQDKLFGVQFHPEKSQSTGLKILKNFVKM